MSESWKDVFGFEGIYKVSSLGRVKVLPRKRHSKSGNIYYSDEKMLKFQTDSDGYFSVTLYKDGRGKSYRINRLVAMHFIPNPDNLPIVHHIDNNKQNNSVENLKWVTVSYNTKNAVDTGRIHIDSTRMKEISLIRGKQLEKSIICVDTNVKYSSLKECSKNIGLGCDAIRRHIVLGEPIDGNIYKYEDPKEMESALQSKSKYSAFKPRSTHMSKKTKCITTGQIFDSGCAAERALGLYEGAVYNSIHTGNPVNGYTFERI